MSTEAFATDLLTCQCRDKMTEHDRDGKCQKCPCTHFDLIYGSYSPAAQEAIAEFFNEPAAN